MLRSALSDACRYGDDAISATNRKHATCTIWSGPYGLDDEELDKLADVLIARGLVNAAAAQVVRGAVELWSQGQIALMLVPRFWATWRFYTANGGFVLPL